jgi:hypothetical protein
MRRSRDIEQPCSGAFLGRVRRPFLAGILACSAGVWCLPGCEKLAPEKPQVAAPVPILDENTLDNLTLLLQDLHRSQSYGEIDRALLVTRRLLPDERRVRLGLSPGVPSDVVRKIVDKNTADVPTEDTKLANYLSGGPEASQVTITSATTEELANESTDAARDFPFAARRVAREGVLRPATTYHLVRLFKPGETIGVPLHLVFWDGQQWTILGPIWRALKDARGDEPPEEHPSAVPAAPVPGEGGGR